MSFNQFFKSTDLNAPVITGQVNSIPSFLDKVLTDRYATASVTSLTESGTNYTAVLPVANSSLVVNDYITFSGASPGGANIAMKINTVTDSTHVICTGPGGLGTITGTILYGKSGLGWTSPFAAGTNSHSYRPPDGIRPYVQIIDNAATAGGAKEAQLYIAEVLTADSTPNNGGGAGSGQCPTTAQMANGICIRKSTSADATARAWAAWGDGKRFYTVISTGDAAGAEYHIFGFGDALTVKAGDAYHAFVGGNATFNSVSPANGLSRMQSTVAVGTGLFFLRAYSQVGSSVTAGLTGWTVDGTAAVIGGLSQKTVTFPNGADSGLYVNPVFMCDASSVLRARLPSIYAPMHDRPLTQYDQTPITGLSGVTGIAIGVTHGNSVGQIIVDQFGPWA